MDGQLYGMTTYHLLDLESSEEEEDEDDSYTGYSLLVGDNGYQDGSECFDAEDLSHLTMSPTNSDASLISIIPYQNRNLAVWGKIQVNSMPVYWDDSDDKDEGTGDTLDWSLV